MKKKGATEGLFEGRIYPFACCSRTNSNSAFCSSCVSWYTFPGIVDGAFGLSSMAWSQICGSGKRCTASSLKTWECRLYLSGISLLPFCDLACSASLDASVCFLLGFVVSSGICILAMYSDPLGGAYGCATACRPAGVMSHVLICTLGRSE